MSERRRPRRASRARLPILIGGGAAVALILVLALIYLLVPGSFGRERQVTPTTALVNPVASKAPASPTSAVGVSTAVVEPSPSPSPAIASGDYDQLLAQAKTKTLASRFEEAIDIYQGLAELDPSDARAEIGWTWALIYDLEAGQALSHAERAVDLEPGSPDAAVALARALIDTGDTARGLAEALRAVELGPNDAEAHAVLALAYLRTGQYQEALDEADLALAQNIQSANAHRVRGWLYLIVDNDPDRALGSLQKAIGLQTGLWLRRHELGQILVQAEDYGLAIIAFQDALGIRPKAVTYSGIGQAYYMEAQYDQARASLQHAVDLGAADVDTLGSLAAAYAGLGRCADAAPYIEQALARDQSQTLALQAQDTCAASAAANTPVVTSTAESTPTPGEEATSDPPVLPGTLAGRIAFPVWNGQSGTYDTYIALAQDGSGRQLVSAQMHQPALSPDGEWLALNGDRPDHVNLFIVKPNGSDLQEVTEFGEDGQPCWAPSGERLVLASNRHGDKQFRIYVLDDIPFAGGKVAGRPLNYGPDDVRGEMPAWTPSNQIVYRGCKLDSPQLECWGLGLYIMSAEPGVQTPRELTSHDGDSAPAVHGSTIAFMSDRQGNWEIYTMGTDGSRLQRLTDNEVQDGLPVWSPDGKAIAFVSDRGGVWAIWAMSTDGSNQRKLFNIGGDGLSGDWQREQISWGP